MAATTAESLRGQVSEVEWRLRQELAAAYRAFAHWGWDDLIFTHLSARIPGSEHHFLLNPYDLGFDEITASNLVKVDRQGKPVLPTTHPTNPAGFIIHSALHMAREDAQCVMHLHTITGQAVSAQAGGLLPICQTAMVAMAGGVAYHEYEGIATDAAERERLISDMGNARVMMLRNHGTLAVGQSVGDAFVGMYFLERACQVQIAAMAGLAQLHPAPAAAIERTAQQASGGLGSVADRLVWPAVQRKMGRLYPDLLT
jgi:ribulose-5-phosphate 4-epimerase/fuculose-1-phosphate aldolase